MSVNRDYLTTFEGFDRPWGHPPADRRSRGRSRLRRRWIHRHRQLANRPTVGAAPAAVLSACPTRARQMTRRHMPELRVDTDSPQAPKAVLGCDGPVFACRSAAAAVASSFAGTGNAMHPRARCNERARAVAGRDPRHVDVRRAVARAGPRRAVARVAVVADPLDRRPERARGPGAGGAAARRPSELSGEPASRAIPVVLGRGDRGHEIYRRAVAVRVVTRLPARRSRAGCAA